MHFGKNYFGGQHVLYMSNGSKKNDYVEQCVHVHLGTTLYSDISIRNINNSLNDLFMRTNILMADFSTAHSSTVHGRQPPLLPEKNKESLYMGGLFFSFFLLFSFFDIWGSFCSFSLMWAFFVFIYWGPYLGLPSPTPLQKYLRAPMVHCLYCITRSYCMNVFGFQL